VNVDATERFEMCLSMVAEINYMVDGLKAMAPKTLRLNRYPGNPIRTEESDHADAAQPAVLNEDDLPFIKDLSPKR